jgi:hypothetical protein
MNCSDCRNPVSESSLYCEWCGTLILKNSSQNLNLINTKARKKALKIIIYIILFLLSLLNTLVGSEVNLFFFTAPPIILYELYLYLVKKYSK